MKPTRASDIMTTVVIAARPDMKLTEAIRLFLRHAVSGMPVVDENKRLVGIITEHDIMNFAFSGNAAETTVAEAMTKNVMAFEPNDEVEKLVACCAQHRIRRVPIVEGGKVVGIVSRRDILREIDCRYSRV